MNSLVITSTTRLTSRIACYSNQNLSRCTPILSSLRSLLTATETRPLEAIPLFSDVLTATRKHVCEPRKDIRKHLQSMLPASQDDLPQRSMRDSILEVRLPIASCPDAKYKSYVGGLRLGRLLHDMDHFAVCVLYKHILNPLQLDPSCLSAHALVTKRMDHLHLRQKIRDDQDVILYGHVTYVSKSTAEVGVRMEQVGPDNERTHVCEARFVLSSRAAFSPLSNAAFLNKLTLNSPEEQHLFKQGKKSIADRAKKEQDSLFQIPPNDVEGALIHKMFLSTIDHEARSFSARTKPIDGLWMTDHKLKSVMLCEPQYKNDYGKVFGGVIMEKCVDLAFSNTWVYTGLGSAPVCMHIDDVVFHWPVSVGDLLYFHSQVVFTHENKVQTRVSAEVKDRKSHNLKLTNVMQITWELPEKVPSVIPKYYHESMMFLTGRRHFLFSLENCGLLQKGSATTKVKEATEFVPQWYCDECDTSEEGGNHELFMNAETTNKIRDREHGAM